MSATDAPSAPSSDTGAIDAENPWPGLASFGEADQEFFFGRESETEELVRLVLRERLTILFGLSGLGKTSLLQAGLFPRLREENVLPVSLRLAHADGSPPYAEQVLNAIARAAAAAGAEIPAPRPGETLWEHFHRVGNDFWSARNRPVVPLLAFDQFEEIFTLGSGRPGAGELIETLASLTEGYPPAAVKARLDENPAEAKEFSFSRHPYKILLSLREDFLPDLEALRDRIRTIGNNRLRVRRMNGENALRVVTLPGGGLLERPVAEEVVRFVAGKSATEQTPLAAMDVEPALLSIVCRELNNKRKARGEAQITARLLEGSRTEILTDLYERSLADLPSEVRGFIEERLITVSGFRDSVALENALATPGVTRAAIDRLTERRLLRIEDRGAGQRLELTHDVLTGVVRHSRDTRRQKEALERAEAERLVLVERERTMRRQLRRNRNILVLVACLLAGVAVLSVLAYRGKLKVDTVLASSDVERALNLQNIRSHEALACLADALSRDPANLGARSLLLDLLLRRPWLLPAREVHHPEALSVLLSPDGSTHAVIDHRGMVQLWDSLGLRRIGEPLRDPAGAISEVDYSADGSRLVTTGKSGTLVWDTATAKTVGGPFANADGKLGCLGPDCRVLIQRGAETTRFFDTVSGGEAGPPVPSADLRTLYSPDGEHILRLQNRGGTWSILVYDVRTGRAGGNPIVVGTAAGDPKLSPDGRLVAVVQEDGHHVRIWDTATGAALAMIHRESPVRYARLWANLLETEAEDSVLSLWDVHTGQAVDHLQAEGSRLSSSLSADEKSYLLLTDDQVLRLRDIETRSDLYQPVIDVTAARLSADRRNLIVVRGNNTVRVLSPTTPEKTLIAQVSRGKLDAADLNDADGHLVALVENGVLLVRDTATGAVQGKSLSGMTGIVWVHFVDHDRKVAVIRHGQVLVWDFQAGHIAGQVPLPGYAAYSDISPDGSTALIVPSLHAVQLIDVASGKPLTGLLPHQPQWQPSPQVPSAATPFTPDGKHLLLTPDDKTLQIVDARTGRVVTTLESPGDAIEWAVFSADGRRLLAVAGSQSVCLWDVVTGRLIHQLKHSRGGSFSWAYFGPDGSILGVGKDFQVSRWNAETGESIGDRLLAPAVTDLRIGPGGRRVLVMASTSARLWSAQTGRPLGNPMVPGGKIFDAAFSADSTRLYLASDTALHVWAVPMGPPEESPLLARLAIAVGGFDLNRNGGLDTVEDPIKALNALRLETANAPLGKPAAASLVHWFFTAPDQRPVRPLVP
ncbi:MAG TPA: WD40 repeat domain-containing protein [Thermoanaerobaculia bacterium]|nr:WD40 repeat domain-containing protein [Thermoanaerobaculia bacterium]